MEITHTHLSSPGGWRNNKGPPIPPNREPGLGAQAGSPGFSFRSAQHSKSLKKTSVPRSQRMAGAECPAPFLFRDRDLFKLHTREAKKAPLPSSMGSQDSKNGAGEESQRQAMSASRSHSRRGGPSNAATVPICRGCTLHTLHYQTWL